MDTNRTILFAAISVLSFYLYSQWMDFKNPEKAIDSAIEQTVQNNSAVPGVPSISNDNGVPGLSAPASNNTVNIPQSVESVAVVGDKVTVETDLIVAEINLTGGSIDNLRLKKEFEENDNPDVGYPLLKSTPLVKYISQSGVLGTNGEFPNHTSVYQTSQLAYELGDASELSIPLSWQSANGQRFTKTFVFKRDSYVVDVDFKTTNTTNAQQDLYLYGQFLRSRPLDAKKGSFLQLPSFMGGTIYTPEDKYKKISFDDIEDENLAIKTNSGWVGMLQHYFVGVWLPEKGNKYQFYSSYEGAQNPEYTIGYKTMEATRLVPTETASLSTSMFLGPKEQSRLKALEKEGVDGLALTVDYGWLTVISNPLFWVLDKINSVVKNWGWSIIILTILIKLAFYPLSAASYRSMAKMKKLAPRMETLKERFADDKPQLQQQMMKLYKEEKVNPAGGCLPMLIQIPVFIALYYVLLESVELRHAPFALWWQDLSAPDPYYVLPVLMGLSMFLQQKLNPAPMEQMQKNIMMIMPLVLTFMFLTFPQGLVLYWVVNNILSIIQQWRINKTIGAE